jgi:hypothetical protein
MIIHEGDNRGTYGDIKYVIVHQVLLSTRVSVGSKIFIIIDRTILFDGEI